MTIMPLSRANWATVGSAGAETHVWGTGAKTLKVARVMRMLFTVLLVLSVICLFLTLFVPVEPWREATGTTYLWATCAFLVMLAANLLLSAAERLWRWLIARKARTSPR